LPDTTYDYERHSQLAGPLTEPPVVGHYSVQFRRLEGSRPIRSGLLVLAALLFVGGFLVWLMLPEHWPHGGDDVLVNVASIVMTVTTGVIGWFAFLTWQRSAARRSPRAIPSR
jgi:drug/metabolite transporter (DMT)-like permease